MTEIPLPPLPEPVEEGREHTPQDRRAMSRRFIIQARQEIEDGNRLQAGEKAWGAVVQLLKMVGEQRDWNHGSNRQIESIGRQIRAEYPDLDSQDLGHALNDAYHKGHENFYENRRNEATVRAVVEDVAETLPSLERMAIAACETPRSFAISTASALRRLKEVTGNPNLAPGDQSPVGFSNRHSPTH